MKLLGIGVLFIIIYVCLATEETGTEEGTLPTTTRTVQTTTTGNQRKSGRPVGSQIRRVSCKKYCEWNFLTRRPAVGRCQSQVHRYACYICRRFVCKVGRTQL